MKRQSETPSQAPFSNLFDFLEKPAAESPPTGAQWKWHRLALIATALIVLLAAVISAVLLTRISLSGQERYTVCRSQACIEYSELLSNALNRSVDPCKDFYQFVCSAWDRTNVKSVLRQQSAEFIDKVGARAVAVQVSPTRQSALEKASKFYQSCVQIAQGVHNEISALNAALVTANLSWPELPAAIDLISTIVYADIHWDCTPLFETTKYILPNDTVVVRISATGTVLAWDFTRNELISKNYYFKYFQRVTFLLTGRNFSLHVFKAYKEKEDQIMNRLLSALTNEENATVMSERTFKNISRAFKVSRWRKAFHDLLGVPGHVATFVEVHAPYFETVNQLTIALGEKVMTTFVAWGILYQLAHLFHQELAVLTYGSYDEAQRDAKYRCMLVVEQYMGMAMSAPYTLGAVDKTTINDVTMLSRHIGSTFSVMLQNREQLNPPAQHELLPSLENLLGFFGNNYSSSELDYYYKGFPDMTSAFAENLFQSIAAWSRQTHRGRMLATNTPLTVRYLDKHNYYRIFDSDRKQLVVWPPLLTEPVFAANITTGLQYGGLGSFISAAYFEAIYSILQEKFTDQRKCLSDLLGTASVSDEGYLFYNAISLPVTWEGFLSASNKTEMRLPLLQDYSDHQVFFLIYCYLRCSGTRPSYPAACNTPLENFRIFHDTFRCRKPISHQCRL